MESRNIPIKFSQNFLRPDFPVARLINTASGIGKSDRVLEIGPGRGALTLELCKKAREVIAFELDPELARDLPNRLKTENLKVFQQDFLQAELERYGEYKVFANIPFFLSAAIVRKLLLDADNLPLEAHLFLQQETAERFLGKPLHSESLMSLLLKTFWDLKITYKFRSFDFTPEPAVNVVLLSFFKRDTPAVINKNKWLFYDFVSFVLNERKPTLKNSLLKLFTYTQLKIIARNLKLQLDLPVRNLNLENWQRLFAEFLQLVEPAKQEITKGSYAKLMRHQTKLNRGKRIVT